MRTFGAWLAFMCAFGLGCDDGMASSSGGDGGRDDAGRAARDSGRDDADAAIPAVDSGTSVTSDAGAPEGCEGGPLELPIADCRPTPLAPTGDPYEDCVRRINQLRWECQCLPPLARWTEGESCADQHAEYDANGAGPHGGFRDRICSPGGRGQNECPGWGSVPQVIGGCLQQMWDEGPGEPFIEHGHYINMTNPAHSQVACGFHTTADGAFWAIQNFQ